MRWMMLLVLILPLQAAAAAAAVGAGAGVLSEEEDIEMARIMEEAATWARANSGGSEGGDMAGRAGDQSIQVDGEAMESNVLAASEIEDSGEESQLFYDKFTKVYVPVSVDSRQLGRRSSKCQYRSDGRALWMIANDGCGSLFCGIGAM